MSQEPTACESGGGGHPQFATTFGLSLSCFDQSSPSTGKVQTSFSHMQFPRPNCLILALEPKRLNLRKDFQNKGFQ